MTEPQPPQHRTIDMSSLKGLAHPLRVRILDTLATYGSFTASGLAERLGESSGSTSYHLRQLERHGFVREDAERGTGRERWWERTPVGIDLNETDFPPRSAERSASQLITREWQVARDALVADFIANGSTELDKRWYDASTLDTANMRLTADQLRGLVGELRDVVERYSMLSKAQQVSGSRPVQVQVNAFPIIDADETP